LIPRCRHSGRASGIKIAASDSADGLEILVDYVAGLDDLTEFESDLRPRQRVFYGAVPGRDDDGVSAVTVTLPDRDSVVRGHPH
jgi:hypothetical protein